MSLLVPWIKSIGHSFKISIVSIKHFSMLFLLVDVLSEIPEKVGNHYIFQMKVFSLTVFSMHILLISLWSLIIYSHFIFKLNICSLDLLFHLLMIVISFQVFLFYVIVCRIGEFYSFKSEKYLNNLCVCLSLYFRAVQLRNSFRRHLF